MNEMRAAHPAEEAPPQKTLHAKPAVNEAVVHERVGDTEQGHAAADPHEARAQEPRAPAPRDDERAGDGRVEEGQRVVPLEPSSARLVVRAVNRPERIVPRMTMEQAGPRLHGARRHGGDGHPDRDVDHGFASESVA